MPRPLRPTHAILTVSFALESILGRIIPATAAEPSMKYLRFIRFPPPAMIHRNHLLRAHPDRPQPPRLFRPYNAPMAAATESHLAELVELGRIRPADLERLLEEEIAEWRSLLNWDFRPSADLVRRFVGLGTLSGFALIQSGRLVGYTYFLHENRKGLVGDLYLLRERRTAENELLLLGAAVRDLFGTMGVERIESQLMMLGSLARTPLPFAERLTAHPRNFMTFDMALVAGLKPARSASKALIDNWSSNREEDAAQVIAQAYERAIDSEVNDQYRSAAGARRFIDNIVQYPGCGTFYPPASLLAIDAWTGRACGVSLCSIVSPGAGHITQLCVVPRLKGKGLGYELLRRSLLALGEAGCHQASLTVTAANRNAVQLYESVGFRTSHTFTALVWEKPPIR
jgi:ribosomal protein S18 acetylase RimI-like enzyme